jgi:hypothetical protein
MIVELCSRKTPTFPPRPNDDQYFRSTRERSQVARRGSAKINAGNDGSTQRHGSPTIHAVITAERPRHHPASYSWPFVPFPVVLRPTAGLSELGSL